MYIVCVHVCRYAQAHKTLGVIQQEVQVPQRSAGPFARLNQDRFMANGIVA